MFAIDYKEDQVEIVRKKWDSLKGSYTRAKKRVPSGSAAINISFKYMSSMSFLEETAKPRASNELGGKSTAVHPPDGMKGKLNLTKSNVFKYGFLNQVVQITNIFLQENPNR